MFPLEMLALSPIQHSIAHPQGPRLLLAHAQNSWLIALALWCACLFFYGLSAGELYRNETLRAILAAEMLRSGDWIVPTLYGEPLLTKPPGMYAAIALISWPFGGVTEATARLPSALAATAVVFLIYWYFARQLGRRAGQLAAILTPIAPMWLDRAPSAEIDMVQVAWVTAAILFALRALESADCELRNAESADQRLFALRSPPSALLWWLASLLCVAGGVLTKWTAPVFFYGTLIPFLCWRGQWRVLFGWQHLLSAALGAGVCFLWVGAAIHRVGWDLFYTTVRNEAIQHLLPGYHHKPHAWYETLAQPLIVLAANLPCSAIALLTLRRGFAQSWDERGRRLLQALHCWTWPNLLFWSWCVGHSVRHGFPLSPGLAGLAALACLAWLKSADSRKRRAAVCGLAGLVGLWLIVKLVFIHAIVPARTAERGARMKGEQLAAAVPLGETLYVSRLKDEGLMFYYGSPVRRFADLSKFPSSREPLYAILTELEWRQWDSIRSLEVVHHLQDAQGDPIVLVKVINPLTGQKRQQ